MALAELLRVLPELVCEQAQPVSPLLLCAAVSAPHFLYAFIWFYPDVWQRLFPKNAVQAFATAGALGKRECVLWCVCVGGRGGGAHAPSGVSTRAPR
jgi:hypothetical protein